MRNKGVGCTAGDLEAGLSDGKMGTSLTNKQNKRGDTECSFLCLYFLHFGEEIGRRMEGQIF
jgi:hypothetical protein